MLWYLLQRHICLGRCLCQTRKKLNHYNLKCNIDFLFLNNRLIGFKLDSEPGRHRIQCHEIRALKLLRWLSIDSTVMDSNTQINTVTIHCWKIEKNSQLRKLRPVCQLTKLHICPLLTGHHVCRLF